MSAFGTGYREQFYDPEAATDELMRDGVTLMNDYDEAYRAHIAAGGSADLDRMEEEIFEREMARSEGGEAAVALIEDALKRREQMRLGARPMAHEPLLDGPLPSTGGHESAFLAAQGKGSTAPGGITGFTRDPVTGEITSLTVDRRADGGEDALTEEAMTAAAGRALEKIAVLDWGRRRQQLVRDTQREQRRIEREYLGKDDDDGDDDDGDDEGGVDGYEASRSEAGGSRFTDFTKSGGYTAAERTAMRAKRREVLENKSKNSGSWW